ncbi:MAG TPA: hypothetical protein VE912_09205 [Bacteroidales bacterium]|nr:hypothetical protein [Bacteroidales bacterium]
MLTTFEMVTHKVLFPTKVNKVIAWVGEMKRLGKITVHKSGPKYIQFIYMGKKVDLFMTKLPDYGRMLAIRTGPNHFSKAMAKRWSEMGWKGVNGQLFLKSELEKQRQINNGRESGIITFTPAPDFPDESSFFDWLGWPYIEPEKREYLYQEPVK